LSTQQRNETRLSPFAPRLLLFSILVPRNALLLADPFRSTFRFPMKLLSANPPDWLTRLIQGLLGILGLYAALRLLPRLLKSMTRRFVFGLIGEILLVAVGLFLTRRATEGPPRNGTASADEEIRRG
jgi:hypothetical protein